MADLGPEGRLDHFVYLQVALLGGVLLSRLRLRVVWRIGVPALALLLFASQHFTSLPHGLDRRFVHSQAELARGLTTRAPAIRPDRLFVTNQADRFVVAWVLPNHAQIHPSLGPFALLLRDIDCSRGLSLGGLIIT